MTASDALGRWYPPEALHGFVPSDRDPLVTCGSCSLPEHNPIHHENKQDVPPAGACRIAAPTGKWQ